MRCNELSVVSDLQLVQSEEGQVRENAVQRRVVTIGRRGVQRKKDLAEYFQEFLVTYAAVKHLLDENFLVRVLELNNDSDKRDLWLHLLGIHQRESRWFCKQD